eukprot:7083189-Pyramimonas_sp.AAC.1
MQPQQPAPTPNAAIPTQKTWLDDVPPEHRSEVADLLKKAVDVAVKQNSDPLHMYTDKQKASLAQLEDAISTGVQARTGVYQKFYKWLRAQTTEFQTWGGGEGRGGNTKKNSAVKAFNAKSPDGKRDYRKHWAGLKLVALKKEYSMSQSYKKADTSTGKYLAFGRIVKD